MVMLITVLIGIAIALGSYKLILSVCRDTFTGRHMFAGTVACFAGLAFASWGIWLFPDHFPPSEVREAFATGFVVALFAPTAVILFWRWRDSKRVYKVPDEPVGIVLVSSPSENPAAVRAE